MSANPLVAVPDAAAQRPYHWTQDLMSSVVVFFVALPLCMGIALASGTPVATGLITGIVGGIVAGALSGCPLQVSGPAAGLTVIVYEIVQRVGLEVLGLVVLVAGGIQIAAGLMKLGQWFRAVSPAVIKGMLAGIGVLIFASQFHVMIDDKPRKSGLENLLSLPEALWKGVGIPNIPEPEEREYRTASLKRIAHLIHEQQNLRTEVGELVPFHEHATAAPELASVHVDELKPLAERQGNISRELEQLGKELATVVEHHGPSRHLTAAESALAAAVVQSNIAKDALASGQAVNALEMQIESAAAIEAASGRLKNHRLAACLGLMTIFVMIFWQKLTPKSWRLIPGPLIGVGLASVIAAVCALPVLYVEIPASLAGEIHWPTMTLLSTAPWAEVIQAGLLIAVVASAETLLSAAAVEKQTTESRTNYDRELTSQGVGNAICGLLGALPMTGVIVRSSANIQAGARTRLSTVLHGMWLLVFVAACGWLLNLIPTASLAAVLVFTGAKLFDVGAIKTLRKFGWGEVAIYFATLGTIVVEDLLTGVIVGVVLAAAKLLYTFSHLSVRTVHDARHDRHVMQLVGAATFVRLPKLAAALEQVPGDAELHVDLARLSYVDHACLDLLTNWANQHAAAGGTLVMDWDSLHASFLRDKATVVEAESTAA
jgi:MFS superfamily sulfate permease-like transporter